MPLNHNCQSLAGETCTCALRQKELNGQKKVKLFYGHNLLPPLRRIDRHILLNEHLRISVHCCIEAADYGVINGRFNELAVTPHFLSSSNLSK